MNELVDEIFLTGSSVCEGIAIGKLFFLKAFQYEVMSQLPIPSSDVEKEIGRYRGAVDSSRQDLHNLQCFLAQEGSTEAVSIMDTHIQMLDDPFMTTLMEKKIRQKMQKTEIVFRSVMAEYEKEFSKVKDSFFTQRLLDVKDLSQRILRNLCPNSELLTKNIPKGSVVFTKELTPSTIAEASFRHVNGFITDIGGMTSHTALIARSKAIPYIANIDMDTIFSYAGKTVIIDGKQGRIIINPKKETLKEYQGKQKVLKQAQIDLEKKQKEKQVTTLDGFRVHLHANVESLEDLDFLRPYGAEGVGLFRTEFLLFGKELQSLSEDGQFEIYNQIVDRASNLPIVFRVFDVGGDKGNINPDVSEANPALGCRGIRFLLKNPEIFSMQLRALLRMTVFGPISILLPLISDVNEVIQVKDLIQELAVELRSQGYKVAKEVSIGSMIEVPSAVMISDLLARECDFLSIGTNDLIQYTLAADRNTKEVQSYCRPTHPSILRMIRLITEQASKYGTPVNLCGEMASDPLMTPLLIGLGIRSFSCAPRHLPSIKKMASKISVSSVSSLINEAITCETADEVEELLRRNYQHVIASIS